MDLKNLIAKDNRPRRWVEFKDGFELDLVFLPKVQLAALARKATKLAFDPKTHQRIEQVDDTALIRHFVTECVKGWRGLTIGIVVTLAPVAGDLSKLNMKEEIPFSVDAAIELMATAYDLERYVRDTVTDITVFQSVPTETALGNFDSSQSGS